MARTDVHAPKDITLENYEFFGAYYTGSNDYNVPDMTAVKSLFEEYPDLPAVGEYGLDWNRCDHCGAHMQYGALLLYYNGSDEDAFLEGFIKVGEICLENRFPLSTDEFQRLRKAAMLGRDQRRLQIKVEEFVEANPIAAWVSYSHNLQAVEHSSAFEYETGVFGDMNYRLSRNAELSGKQLAFIDKLLTQMEHKWLAEIERSKNSKPAPIGKHRVEGIVVGFKTVDTDYGPTRKMIVACDGYKVYVTVPAAIADKVEKGSRVEFQATLMLSTTSPDPSFAFGRRPSQARIVG